MQQLVFRHDWGDEGCCGEKFIPFWYSSKDDFVLKVWEIQAELKKNKVGYIHLELFDSLYITDHEMEYIDSLVYTVEEYFNRFNQKTKI